MNKKKLLSLAMAGVLSLSLFAGCASNGGGTATPAPGGAATPAPAPAGTPAASTGKTVVYWSMWESTEPQGQAIQEAVAAFQTETGIQVDLQFKGRSGIREGLQPALDAGQVVDLFDEDIDRINTTFKSYLLDLTDLAAKTEYEKTAIPGLIAACKDVGGGKLMSIPYQPNVFNFFYNKGLFAAAGITAEPKTWAEFLDVCQKLKDSGVIPITCDDAYITCMIGYHLGRLVGEDGVRDIVNNNKWDDPAVAQFAKDYADLAAKGYFSPNITGNVFPAGQNTELATGAAAMYLDGSWMPNEVYNIAGDSIDWGCFSYPALDGGKTGLEAANFGAQVFAINNKTQVADEAFQLICYLTKGPYDQNLSQKSIGIPADTANTEWPSLLKNVQPVMNTLTTRWSWAVGVESNNDMTAIIKENTLKLVGGSITSDQFVDNMKKAAG